jgi:hypothetical protein
MQHRTTERGCSRIRKFGQIMFQDHLLDVFVSEKFLFFILCERYSRIMQHRTTERGISQFVISDNLCFGSTCLMFVFQRSVFPTKFSRYSRRMQERTIKPASSRVRKLRQIMCQDQLLDVFLGDEYLPNIVFRGIPK